MKGHLHIVVDNIYTKQLYDFLVTNEKYKDHYFLLVDLELGNAEKFFKGLNENIYRFKKTDFKNATSDDEIYQLIKNFGKVYIHYLYNFYCDLIMDLEFDLKMQRFYWIVWGADLYDFIPYDKYDENVKKRFPETLHTVEYSNAFLEKRKNLIKNLAGICTTSTHDYNLIQRNYSTSTPRINFQYNMTHFLEEINEKQIIRNKYKEFCVFVGNSGDISNNHETIFNQLSNFLSKNCKIIVPLSYGKQEYINKIKNIGKHILNDMFEPLEEYLDFNNYVELLNNVDVIIMNHYRQQGVGNALIALYLGKPLFLSEKTSVYHDFVEKGFLVHKTEMLSDITLEQFNYLCSLNFNENQIRFKNLFGEQFMEEMYDEIFYTDKGELL